jgi:hypothetical protein
MECEKCLGTNLIRIQNNEGFVAGKCLDCGEVNPT